VKYYTIIITKYVRFVKSSPLKRKATVRPVAAMSFGNEINVRLRVSG